jgi:GT2 family glycosyltransferase
VSGSAPLVRVVVVNYNGGPMTLECLRALLETDWPRGALEVVLVDNASCDGLAASVTQTLPQVQVIRSDRNRGFGGGVNLGLRDPAPGTEFVALVNNDATVDPGWLRPLVATLAENPDLGAACPKILLADHYEEIKITGPGVRRSWSDPRRVTARVCGARIDDEDVFARVRFAEGFYGTEFSTGPDGAVFEWGSERSRLLMPAEPTARTRQLFLAGPRHTRVVISTGTAETAIELGPAPRWCELPPSPGGFRVINNVGSELLATGYVRDRGYLERDVGQYERSERVFAWCGGAVLLSAAYLRSVGNFDEDLFLYYEDVELAWRGRARGWDYATVPQSVVHHRHMATSSSRLPVTLYFNERNRLLVLSRHRSKAAMIRAVARFVAATLSYFRRDVIARILRGERPSLIITGARLRALVDCLLTWSGLASLRKFTTRRVR